MEITTLIILIGAVQGFFVAALIWFKREIFQRKLFSLVLFSISLALFLAYLQSTVAINDWPVLVKTSLPLPLLFIPGLYIYLKKLLYANKQTKFNWLLFSPFVVIIAYNIPFYLGNKQNKLDYFLRSDLAGKPTLTDSLEHLCVDTVVMIFSLLAVIETKKYHQKLSLVFADTATAKKGWISLLAYAMLVLTLFAFVLSVGRVFTTNIPIGLDFVTAIGATLVVFLVAYYIVFHPGALGQISLNLSVAENNSKPIIENTENENLKEISALIIAAFEKDQIFLNPELTLAILARHINTPGYLVSKTISKELNTNFYNLVNDYRLNKVKKDLPVKDGRKILEKALDAGFNSKTSFYEVFKKDGNPSPSQFIKQHSEKNV